MPTGSRHLPTARLLAAGALALAALLAPAAPLARAAGPPLIVSAWATEVTATSATLHAEINPGGTEASYRFEYLTEEAFQAKGESFTGASRAPSFGEATLGEESSPQPALQHLISLTPDTTYRYRILTSRKGAETSAGEPLAFTTEPPGSAFALPDDRAWELVSPVGKNGGAVQGFGANFGGGVLQAAADGEAATFNSASSFAGGMGAPTASQYIARRVDGEAGWATENVTAPTLSGAYGNANSGVPYQLFSIDLATGLLLNGRRCGAGAECPRGYSLRASAGGALTPSPEAPDLRFAGATPNLVHLVLSTCAALTPDAIEEPGVGGSCDPAAPNLYEWSGAAPQLINILPGHSKGTPSAALGAQAGAISANGARVYWVGSGGDLYLYEAGQGKLLDGSGAAVFQLASADGQLAYFLKAGHLYRYATQTEAATDLTPGGAVEGVLGASADGSRVYYATAAGLFLWREGAPSTTTEIVAGAPGAFAGDYPPTTGTARLSADGTHLAFLSAARLSGYDNTDQHTGLPDSELYVYGAGAGSQGTLTCASCNPTGERPLGPSTIPGAIANGETAGATDSYKPRVLSANGERLFFDSADRLVPQDNSAAADVYEWEAGGSGTCSKPNGCLALTSSGKSSEASQFIDASESGADAFFLTGESLVPRDPGSVDLYDAREGGGIPEPAPVIPCEGDACQPVPSPPDDPAPGTTVAGRPNRPVHFPKAHQKKPSHKKGDKHHRRKDHRPPQRRGGGGR